ncbi:MAG: universal stress protein UspA [Clostridiales bacterium]|nr:universal stress protein UspA [Clostridiales bacterium]
MVCVTRQKTCERLIKVGRNISIKREGDLKVVHVAKIGDNFLGNPDEGEAVEYLFQRSKTVGAEMTVLRADDTIGTIVEYAKKNNIDVIILGEGPSSKDDENIIKQIERRLPGVELRVVPA